MRSDSARPLSGRTILVTRPAHQANVLTQLVEQAGGRIVLFPAIAIEPPVDPKGAALLLHELEGVTETFPEVVEKVTLTDAVF